MSRTIDSQSLQQISQRSDRDIVYVGYRQRGRAVVVRSYLNKNASLQTEASSW